MPGGVVFEVAENLRKGVELIIMSLTSTEVYVAGGMEYYPESTLKYTIGRPEIDSWDIVFTSEGPKLRRVPLEFEII